MTGLLETPVQFTRSLVARITNYEKTRWTDAWEPIIPIYLREWSKFKATNFTSYRSLVTRITRRRDGLMHGSQFLSILDGFAEKLLSHLHHILHRCSNPLELAPSRPPLAISFLSARIVAQTLRSCRSNSSRSCGEGPGARAHVTRR